MSTSTLTPKGLEGVIAAVSSICYIDGDHGILAYRGIDIHELADNSTFEEVCYLLWFGKLPNRAELQRVHPGARAMNASSTPAIISLLRQAPQHALPMDVLRTVVSALSLLRSRGEGQHPEANLRKSIRLTSQIAMIVAAYDRIRKGKPLVEPDRSLSHAANFLLMLNGEPPSQDRRARPRHRSHPARRPRTERLHLRRARDRRHAIATCIRRSPPASAR